MRSITLITILTVSISAFAQRYVDTYDPKDDEVKSILGRGNDLNGFGSAEVKVSEMIGERGLIVGGNGGLLVNRKYLLGLGGYGIVTNLEFDGISGDVSKPLNLYAGYGGMVVGGIIGSKEVIHLVIPVLIGAGSAEVSDKDFFPDQPQKSEFSIENSAFLVVEPGAQLEVNITENFRVALGMTYRYVSGLRLDNLTDDDLTGTSIMMSVRFGRF